MIIYTITRVIYSFEIIQTFQIRPGLRKVFKEIQYFDIDFQINTCLLILPFKNLTLLKLKNL